MKKWFIEASQGLGIARSLDEVHDFARVLDDDGVILIFLLIKSIFILISLATSYHY